MSASLLKRTAMFGVVAVFAVLAIGCGQQQSQQSKQSEPESPKVAEASHDGHNHRGWWCTEHGIPEEECSMCSTKAADKCKAGGDWCEEHNRAESQCFICDPSRAEKYAKLYEAKFGEKPPKRGDEKEN